MPSRSGAGVRGLERRRRSKPRLSALAFLLVVVLVVAWPGSQGTRASSVGDASDVAREPIGRGHLVLDAREAVLRQQTERAERAARRRGLTLYRVLRFAALERRAGARMDSAGEGRLGGRAVVMGTAILERDLLEARSLRAEWERVRAVRGAGPDGPAAAASAPVADSAHPPSLLRPVGGAMTAPYGIVRDAATSAWFFRSAVAFAPRPSEVIRCPAAGRVTRVARSLSGEDAVVLTADAAGWTVIVSGLANVAVVPGQVVRRGEALGHAEAQRPAAVRLETWRGRTPVNPAALLD